MFKLVDWAGDPLDDDYAEQRHAQRATGRDHPGERHVGDPSAAVDTDEWADFEIMPYRVATMLASEPSGRYCRERC